jgi:hypothetical protein
MRAHRARAAELCVPGMVWGVTLAVCTAPSSTGADRASKATRRRSPPRQGATLASADELAMNWGIAPVQGFKGLMQCSAYLSSTTTCRYPRSNKGGSRETILAR